MKMVPLICSPQQLHQMTEYPPPPKSLAKHRCFGWSRVDMEDTDGNRLNG